MFLPALLLFFVGLAFVPSVVFLDLSKGHWESTVLLLPLAGGAAGLVSALLVTCDIAGNSLLSVNNNVKRLGLIAGILSELAVVVWLPPNMEPFLYYWLPELFGGVVLLPLSYLYKNAK